MAIYNYRPRFTSGTLLIEGYNIPAAGLNFNAPNPTLEKYVRIQLDRYVDSSLDNFPSDDIPPATPITLPPDTVTPFFGSIVSGAWIKVTNLVRLRITGTGTITIDLKDSLGNITITAETIVASNETDRIEYPFIGNDTIYIRVNITGSATAEII